MIGFAASAALLAMHATSVTSRQPGHFSVNVDGHEILEGVVKGFEGTWNPDRVHVETRVEPCEPMFLGYPHGPKTADWTPAGRTKTTYLIHVDGTYQEVLVSPRVSQEAFACTTRTDGPLVSTVGLAWSSLDDGIYDRKQDQLIEVPGGHVVDGNQLAVGPGAIVKVSTGYYRNHLGYFLWDASRPLWPKPIAGWCSWAAYGQQVTEGEVTGAAEFFSRELKDYGYSVIQIDDGYQRVLQLKDQAPLTEPFSDYWTKANSQFPSGMAAMAKTISGYGLVPGIWVGLYLPLGLKHEQNYVTGADGKPLKGPWVGYSVDATKPAAVAEAYTNTLTAFREEGWTYFKIDTLRHVLYDSYRRVPDYWAQRGTTSSDAFRSLFQQVRHAVGEKNYLLACWGALPELAGLPDGCRIGEDVGPDVASLKRTAKYIAQFQHANDVVWRNDPDYMCFRLPAEACRTWATLTALAGGHVMVSDPIETYDAEKTEILRKVGPPMVSRPGTVAPHGPGFEWMVLNAQKEGQAWTVAARMAWDALPAKEIPLTTLGLDPAANYLAFDFWNARFLGTVSGSLACQALPEANCQVISLRKVTGMPQFLGDDRHIGQGVEECQNVKWKAPELQGEFLATEGHEWHVFVYAPLGWSPAPGQNLQLVQPGVYSLIVPAGKGWHKWKVSFLARS